MEQQQPLQKTIVLVGMMGAGKSSVGRALALRLGVPFWDLDGAIERAASKTVAEIFADHGEACFRHRESLMIAQLLHAPPGVLATGGGAFISAKNRALIADWAVSVWLDADLELLWQRVRHQKTRPLLQTPTPRETLATLHGQRLPKYRQARLRLKVKPHLTETALANKIADCLQRCPDASGRII